MQELIAMVVQKAGIPESAARIAVEAVLGHLKTKMPAAVASQIDAIIGGSAAAGMAQKGLDVARNLGGMMGQKDK